jgi:hypothetical protein
MRNMPATKFTQAICDRIVASVAAGVSLSDAARASSLDPRTVRGWIQRGRQEGEGAFCAFAEAVDAGRAEAEEAASGPLSEVEVRQLLEDQIRGGSIRALEVWFREYGRVEPDRPLSGIELLDAGLHPVA